MFIFPENVRTIFASPFLDPIYSFGNLQH